MAETLSLPGFVNAHSHAFQRALRGPHRGRRLLGLARRDARRWPGSLTAEQVRAGYVQVYREMLDAGYTAVGEFHYLGLAEAHAAVEAAAEAGIELVLLLAAYGRGGIERFRQESVADYLSQLEELRAAGVRVGLAPHSVRACPRDWLEELGRYAAAEALPLHVHADEQPREIEECLAEHGAAPDRAARRRPAASARTRRSSTRPTPTRASSTCSPRRARASASARRPRPTSATASRRCEALCERGIGICIGSDSNVRIDPLEELRELEGIARRRAGQAQRRLGLDASSASAPTRAPPRSASSAGPTSRSTSSTRRWRASSATSHAALVFGCAADVFA